MPRALLVFAFTVLPLAGPAAAAAPPRMVKVVATLPSYASIAQFVGGSRVRAVAIARGNQDPRAVEPRPADVLALKDADLFVSTGLDLELWAPVLVDKSGNPKIRDGQPGYVNASQGVPLLGAPINPSVSAGPAGGGHVYGNPHLHTSPLNAKIIAANIAAGLKRIDPGNAEAYAQNLAAFDGQVNRRLYGDRLPEILGPELDTLARQDKLISYLESQDASGRKLIDSLGGWLKKGMAFRGREVVTYHQDWDYFAALFGLDVAGDVEPKPGIPPSARDLQELIQLMKSEQIRVVMAPGYLDPAQPKGIAQRAGARAVILPLEPDSTAADAYFRLIDLWVSRLAEAYR